MRLYKRDDPIKAKCSSLQLSWTWLLSRVLKSVYGCTPSSETEIGDAIHRRSRLCLVLLFETAVYHRVRHDNRSSVTVTLSTAIETIICSPYRSMITDLRKTPDITRGESVHAINTRALASISDDHEIFRNVLLRHFIDYTWLESICNWLKNFHSINASVHSKENLRTRCVRLIYSINAKRIAAIFECREGR